MPANLSPEFMKARGKYEKAETLNDKIKYTQEMISQCPKHKGAEKVLKNLKKRLKKLKEKREKREEVKKGGYSLGVQKQGFQVCIIGYPNTGKSTLLNKLTNADSEVARYPYTTKEPEVGMMKYEGAQLQLVDLPPVTEGAVDNQGEVMSVVKNTDGLILMLGENPEKEKKAIENELKRINEEEKPTLILKKSQEISKEEIFDFFDLIKIYTKKPGKEADMEDPLVLKRGSTVEEACEEVHRDFAKKLKYAKVWGSSQFDGQRVKKNHVLEDDDILEIHIK